MLGAGNTVGGATWTRCTTIVFRVRIHCFVVCSIVFLANPARRSIVICSIVFLANPARRSIVVCSIVFLANPARRSIVICSIVFLANPARRSIVICSIVFLANPARRSIFVCSIALILFLRYLSENHSMFKHNSIRVMTECYKMMMISELVYCLQKFLLVNTYT